MTALDFQLTELPNVSSAMSKKIVLATLWGGLVN
jgi:hypothetical protein